MSEPTMPADQATALVAALQAHDVTVCVGGGWAVDALVGTQSRPHADLDVWLEAPDFEGLFVAIAEQGVDRISPWPGDRPWNFVLHDGRTRRVDLHVYEDLGDGRLHYGSVTAPVVFSSDDLAGEGRIGDMTVRCERPEFALRNRTGYPARDVDRHDVAVLCEHFGLQTPESYR
jgi:lincosamide nucleotidyltransferase A/C/D/E